MLSSRAEKDVIGAWVCEFAAPGTHIVMAYIVMAHLVREVAASGTQT